jgi:hypothetical protein
MVIRKIYDERISNSELSDFALGYDVVKHHKWYENLDYLVDKSIEYFNNDSLIMDYSCGTGIIFKYYF